MERAKENQQYYAPHIIEGDSNSSIDDLIKPRLLVMEEEEFRDLIRSVVEELRQERKQRDLYIAAPYNPRDIIR